MKDKATNILSFPSTFQIAIFLSFVVFLAVWLFSSTESEGMSSAFEVLLFWRNGFWELLEFTMQMILILVLGYALATSSPAQKLLNRLSDFADTNTKAVIVTGLTGIFAGYLNWGFGLVLGAILARQIGESAKRSGSNINYPLVGASGYLGMLVWHGGLSASSALKVAEEGHFLQEVIGVIPISETIFSAANLWINLMLVVTLFLLMYFLSIGKFPLSSVFGHSEQQPYHSQIPQGKGLLGKVLGIFILAFCTSDFLFAADLSLAFIDLNYVNFALLGLGFLVFGDVEAYFRSIARGLAASTDLLVQFPFYAGILGMMKYSGFLAVASEWLFKSVSMQFFPLVAFGSAALVNLFIPSGGGQWAVQGPVLMDAGIKLGIDPADLILAFSYGDQVTNMLQPFWALPLLSITGIPAKSLLKYTFFFFLAAFLVFSIGIYAFM